MRVSQPSNTDLAPVALFIFNRPQLTAKVFECIRQARPKKLLVVADGPRKSRPDEGRLCEATRDVVLSPDWPCELVTNFASENMGCRNRLHSGLEWVFGQCSEAIIVEDDCLTNVSFFEYCSEMLRRYCDDERIAHVSGSNYQDGIRRGDGSYFFSRYTLSWGWATWRRAWKHYDVKISQWPAAYRQYWLESILEDREEVRFWETLFDRQYRGLIDTWDYQWLFTCWRRNGLSIHPNVNLVSNIGAGPDATHFREGGHSTLGLPICDLGECKAPSRVMRDAEADRYTFLNHIASKPPADFLRRLKRRLALRDRAKRMIPRSMRYR